VRSVDWEQWSERTQSTLAVGSGNRFRDLFAPGGRFSDPVTAPTTDIASIEQITESSFPDWHQEITSIRGDASGCAFEWIGRGTLGGTTPLVIEGCTVVAIDSQGLVREWRDYFDLQAIDRQVRDAGPSGGP
jgi:limonene-1,2-epoxide hydrolase